MTDERVVVAWVRGALTVVKIVSLVWAVHRFSWLVLVPIAIAVLQVNPSGEGT